MRATPPRSRSKQSRFWLGLVALGALSWSACSKDDDPSTQHFPPAAAGAIAPSSGGAAPGSGGKSDNGTAGESSGGSDGGQGGGSGGAPNTGGAATGGGASGGAASGGAASGGDASGGASSGGTSSGGAASGGVASSGGSSGTGGSSSEGPTIEVWHDDKLEVGGPRAAGLPQGFANVLGRIGFTGSSLSASYRLNDGPSTSMPVGATATRLARRGDFNIELPIDSLLPYPAENRVRISATDPEGTTEHELSVFLEPTQMTTPSLDIDWSTLEDIAELDDMAAIVDGHWDLRDSGVHVAELGYDRLIAVGDRSWPPGYEVVAEVTLHDFRSYGGLGIAIGWQGHTGTANPRTGWPLEALGWVRFRPDGPEAQLMTYTQNEIAGKAVEMTSGAAYVYKVRSDRLGNGLARFSLKFWPRGTSEPTEWILQRDVPERAGSVLLVAHHTEATWETLRVTPTP